MNRVNFSTAALCVFILIFLFTGCSPKQRYDRRLKHELASGIRNDSLFMGIYLGMPSREFYAHCWDLNKKGLVRQGAGNKTVEYQMNNELNHPALMNFYPHFKNDKIYDMPVKYKYVGWAPWNKELSSKKLQQDIKKYYEKKYGKGFITVKHPERGTAYIKIDGNRRITIFTKDDLDVWVIFTDLTVTQKLIMNPETFQNAR
ncbi:MAG TPA: hypothetical protein VK179_19285 [Bacteroidales bacterium]|nr:hypothetical protein [Bacteroidales bacterium]